MSMTSFPVKTLPELDEQRAQSAPGLMPPSKQMGRRRYGYAVVQNRGLATSASQPVVARNAVNLPQRSRREHKRPPRVREDRQSPEKLAVAPRRPRNYQDDSLPTLGIDEKLTNWETAMHKSLQIAVEDRRKGALAAAVHAYGPAKEMAHTLYREGNYADGYSQLSEVLHANDECDALHRFRAKTMLRAKKFDLAVKDANRAIKLNPGSPMNYRCHALCLHHNGDLLEAGGAYLMASGVGHESRGHDEGFKSLLHEVRRDRPFHNPVRPTTSLSHSSSHKVIGLRTIRPNIFDPRKRFDDVSSGGSAPAPPLLAIDMVTHDQVHFTWRTRFAKDVDIFQYELQLAPYEVFWHAPSHDFASDWRSYDVVKSFSGRTMHACCTKLPSNTCHRARIRARNHLGFSAWSEEVQFVTKRITREDRLSSAAIPRSWLRVDLLDLIMYQQRIFPSSTAKSFFQELAQVLMPHVRAISRIFKYYCRTGESEMTSLQFSKFVKDMRLGLVSIDRAAEGFNPLDSAAVGLLFQRANILEQHRATGMSIEELTLIAERALDEINAAKETTAFKDDANYDGGLTKLVLREFVGALIRIAWVGFAGDSKTGVGQRLKLMLETVVLPECAEAIVFDDPLSEELLDPRVAAVFSHYEKQMRAIFKAYSAADKRSAEARRRVHTMSLEETVYMFKEGNVLDENLTMPQLSNIFGLVNAIFEENGDDDDEQELEYEEFVQVVARVCDAKVPADRRGDEPFPYTLQSWLEIIFLPPYKSLLTLKKKGVLRNEM